MPTESYLYDSAPKGIPQHVRKTSNGTATHYPNQLYETSSSLYYMQQDQLGNLALVTSGGAAVKDQGFYAYGRAQRAPDRGIIDV